MFIVTEYAALIARAMNPSNKQYKYLCDTFDISYVWNALVLLSIINILSQMMRWR